MTDDRVVAAFLGDELLCRGPLSEVTARCRAAMDDDEQRRLAVFDDSSGRVVDLDLREPGPELEPAASTAQPQRRKPGRPKLGVVSREVSLLPRHWRWLAEQGRGTSATLRRLVQAAMKHESEHGQAQRAVEAAHRFLWDIAGDQPNFEETTRALFSFELDRIAELTAQWPTDIRAQLDRFIERARALQQA